MPKERPLQFKALYLQAAEARAARLGLTTEELLERCAKRIRESKYPTRDCLTSDRVQHHAWGSALSDAEKKHVSDCQDCRALLDEAARPSKEILEPLLKEVRRLAVKAAAHAVGSGHRRRSFR
jgi:hypothetical protein